MKNISVLYRLFVRNFRMPQFKVAKKMKTLKQNLLPLKRKKALGIHSTFPPFRKVRAVCIFTECIIQNRNSYHQPFGLGPPRPPPPVAAIISLISSLVTYSVPMTTSSQVTTFRFFSTRGLNASLSQHLLLLLLPYSNYFSSSPKMRL